MTRNHQNLIRISRRRPYKQSRSRSHQFESLENRWVLDSTVVFNEIMYNPSGQDDGRLEWIEFYNQLTLNMDISDWRIEGGVDFKFPDKTVVPGRGRLVVAADPAALREATGLANVLGPWTGRLDNGGEELRLYNNDGRLMNRVQYGDGGDWPVAADGGGVSVAKRDELSASEVPGNWTFSPQPNGTPGRTNFVRPGTFETTDLLPESAPAFAVVPSDDSLGQSWVQSGFNESTWLRGTTGIGFDNRPDYDPFLGLDLDQPPDSQPAMPMVNVNGSVYIRIPFQVKQSGNEFDQLKLRMRYDDGFVAYLNGVEVASANAPGRDGAAGTLTWDATATRSHSDRLARNFDEFDITPHQGLLVAGNNVLAIHGLNQSRTDSDGLFYPVLVGLTEVLPQERLSVRISEVAAFNDPNFYVELANTGSEPVDIGGLILSSTAQHARDYVFPPQTLAPGAAITVTADQLGYRPADRDLMLLWRPDRQHLVDGRRTTGRLRGLSERYPNQWLFPDAVTPGSPNRFTLHDDIVINEIMYHPFPQLSVPDVPPMYARTDIVPYDSQWKYNRSGTDLGPNWAQTTYSVDNVSWLQGQGPLGYETSTLAVPLKTEFPSPSTNNPRFLTYYFQTEFTIEPEALAQADVAELWHMINDGVVVYLNGHELHRFNMPAGDITFDTRAASSVSTAEVTGPFDIPKELLKPGKNVLSAEVHLSSTTSSDVTFGARITVGDEVTPRIPGRPYAERDEEWIELYNRGTQVVDLSGWQLRDAVEYSVPDNTMIGPGEYLVIAKNAAAMRQTYPNVRVIGNFIGTMNDHDGRIRLFDAFGNPADEVHYYESGRWSEYADGGGSSLELRNPFADNSRAEAWAASDESAKSEWMTYTFRGISQVDVAGGRARYNEYIFGLLDTGEFLIDDITVVQDPDGQAQQLIQNGTFQDDTLGEAPAKWRVIGNHSGTVVADTTQPDNKVLHVVATGAHQHVHDHAETTFVNNTRIEDGAEYQISFRAKWLAGNSQLNSRLYFNRLSNTARLTVPQKTGTPGARNSRYAENVGPTFSHFLHEPTTPQADEPVTVTAGVEDPDRVTTVTLHWRLDGQDWQSQPMSRGSDGRYQATLPGQSARTIVQFYVQATDGSGMTATFPAAGPESRALYQVEDGRGPTSPIDRFRIIMLRDDQRRFFDATNNMSNWFIPITMVHNQDSYYDVSVRQVGSRWIRPNSGYKVKLHPDKAFYGVHDSLRIDLNGLAEIVMKQMVNRAGGSQVSMYDDIAYLVSPNSGHSHEFLLQLARLENTFLDEQFPNGSEGTKWELDDVTMPTSPRGGVEGLKAATDVNTSADIGVNGSMFRQQGDNPEFYRGHLLIKSQRAKDDFQAIVDLASSIHQTGDALFQATNEVMDVDLWMRHYATQSYLGNWDTYGFGRPKNLRIYTRPTDNKIIPFFWDCDLCNFTEPILRRSEATSRLDEIRDIPHNLRLFWGHMLDLINRSFNEEYVATWASHYGEMAAQQTHGGDESFSSIVSSTRTRSAQALREIERAIPPVDFQITTNDGNGFSVNGNVATLEGKGWVNVRQIRLAGSKVPLDAFWPEKDGWRIELPLNLGVNEIALEAVDFEGNVIATDTITVTSSVANPVADFLRITEVHYHPAPPSPAEGFADGDEFEFIELTNIGSVPISLQSVRLVQIGQGADVEGVAFDFATGAIRELTPGQHVVVVENLDAFQARYGTNLPVAGQWIGGLGNRTETITLTVGGRVLQSFSYSDAWYPATDGRGPSLQVVDINNSDLAKWGRAEGWRPSFVPGGSPGRADTRPGDVNGDGVFNSNDLVQMFQSSKYENGLNNATLADGDFSGDGNFTTEDLVLAFKYGAYTTQAQAARATLSGMVTRAEGVNRRDATRSAGRAEPTTSATASTPRSIALDAAAVDAVFRFERPSWRLVGTQLARRGGRVHDEPVGADPHTSPFAP